VSRAKTRRARKPRALNFGPFDPRLAARNIVEGLDGVQVGLEKARDEVIEGTPLAGLRTLMHLASAIKVQQERARGILTAIARVES